MQNELRTKLIKIAKQFIAGSDTEILQAHLKNKHLKFQLLNHLKLNGFRINNANINNMKQVEDVLKVHLMEEPKKPLESKHENLFIN